MTGNDIVVDLNGDMLDVHTTVVMSSHVPSWHDEYSSGLEDTCFGPPKRGPKSDLKLVGLWVVGHKRSPRVVPKMDQFWTPLLRGWPNLTKTHHHDVRA